MPEPADRLVQRLANLPPTFTARQARAIGLPARDLAALSSFDEIEEISRGVYRRADAAPTAHIDLLAVCTRAPHAVVCGESALALHELIDDIPYEVHIAVPRGAHRPAITYPPTRTSQYAANTFGYAVNRFEAAAGEDIPVYSPARAVVDSMRLGGAAGRPLALGALNRYVRRYGQSGLVDLREAAQTLGGLSTIRPAIEAVLA